MRKKIVALLTATALVLSGCGDAKAETAANTETAQTGTSVESQSSDLEAVGNVEVEKELFDVSITLPAQYVGEATQEELDKTAKEKGYKITLNEDGSATYVMSKSQHKAMLKELAESFNEELAEMANSENYPNFTEVTANSDFTQFTITTKESELGIADSFSVIVFYTYGGMYNIFNGTKVDNIHVDFINADTGEVISSADSKDAGAMESTPD